MKFSAEQQQRFLDLADGISRLKPSSCSCDSCKELCAATPCMGTPHEIKALIDAGWKHALLPTVHYGGPIFGLPPIRCIMIRHGAFGGCSMFVRGKCALHSSGLKPSEGKFANCVDGIASFPNIAATWLLDENRELIESLFAQFPTSTANDGLFDDDDDATIEFMGRLALAADKIRKFGILSDPIVAHACDVIQDDWHRLRREPPSFIAMLNLIKAFDESLEAEAARSVEPSEAKAG